MSETSRKSSRILMTVARAVPLSLGVRELPPAHGKGHGLDVSLCGFIVSLWLFPSPPPLPRLPPYPPYCSPTTSPLIWAFYKVIA